MKLKNTLSIAALLLCCVSCEFDKLRNKVVKERLRDPWKGVCTLTADQEVAVAGCNYNEQGNYEARLKSFHAGNGQLIAVCPFTLTGSWSVRAVAPDAQDTSEFWTLHANGYRIKWTENFGIVTFGLAPPSLGQNLTMRMFFDMDIGADGTIYLTIAERNNGLERTYLYRKTTGGQWTRGTALDGQGFPLMYKECRVDHDDISGKTLILETDTCKVIQFSGTTPGAVIDLPQACAPGQHGYQDIATYGGQMTLATTALGAGGRGRLLQMEVVSGEVTDFLDFGKPVALAIKAPRLPGQVQEVSVFVAGLDYFPGKYGLVELTLKYDD
jgi:hypothetical protein